MDPDLLAARERELTLLFALFFGALAATLIALLVALVLARQHRVDAHIAAVVVFVLLLLVTLFFAERLGARFDFQATAQRIHLTLAYLTSGFLLAPLGSGIQHWRGRARREVHARLVAVFLALAVATIATGLWMLSGRTPKTGASARPAGEALG